MQPRLLDYLILLQLSKFPNNTWVRSKLLTEEINKNSMNIVFSQQAVTSRLKILKKGSFVEQKPNPNLNRIGRYPLSYWKVSDHGRSQFIASEIRDFFP